MNLIKRLIVVNPDGTIAAEKEVKTIKTNPDGTISFELAEAQPTDTPQQP